MKLKTIIYLFFVYLLNVIVLLGEWGGLAISLVILLTYFLYRPKQIFHPNNILFAFYGLYVVLSCTLNFILYVIEWEYVLPWGQFVFWSTFSKYTLFQIEYTFLILFFSFYFFTKSYPSTRFTIDKRVRSSVLFSLYFILLICIVAYVQLTAGLQEWLFNYSLTYTSQRAGYGWLNLIIMTLGNILVFLLGIATFRSRKKALLFTLSIIIIVLLGYFQGLKSRLPFLLILYFFPLIVNVRLTNLRIVFWGLFFIAFLYVTTLLRTHSFYASFPAFIEHLIGYFNTFQLHDYVVTSQEPDVMTTMHFFLNKYLQIAGLAGENAEFDISIMLTKEYFPQMWENQHATQQWPLDTELYLNFYGMFFGWTILLLYAFIISKLYKFSIVQKNYFLIVIYLMEFLRLFSTLRGTILPWTLIIVLIEYFIIYYISRKALIHAKQTHSSLS